MFAPKVVALRVVVEICLRWRIKAALTGHVVLPLETGWEGEDISGVCQNKLVLAISFEAVTLIVAESIFGVDPYFETGKCRVARCDCFVQFAILGMMDIFWKRAIRG